jgi:beta-lactamase class A
VTNRIVADRTRGLSLLALSVIISIIALATIARAAEPVLITPTAATPVASPLASPSAGPISDAQREQASVTLTTEVPPLLTNDPGVFGVMVVDPAGQIVYEHNADLPFITASLYKLPLMAQIYAMAESGWLTLDQEIILDPSFYPYWDEGGDSYYGYDSVGLPTTVGEALYATGAYSSNVGAFALASLTTWWDIQVMAESLGMLDTYLVVYPQELALWPPAVSAIDDVAALSQAVAFIELQALEGPVMITTPQDIATFFVHLLAGEVVSPATSAAITDILSQQMVNDRFPMLLPPETQLVHKTGNLTGIVHDAGIIYTPSGPVILAALSEANYDDSVATWIIQELARTTYSAFTPPGAATPTP